MSLTPPWNEHRVLAESISQSIADALTSATGQIVELGKATSFDPEAMLRGRTLPLRAVVVQMRRPLRDVMIFITSLKGNAVRPFVEAAASAAINALDVPVGSDQLGSTGRFEIEDVVEYETLEEALDQCDALYLEASYPLELPTGELRLVLGTGLLESAAYFTSGVPDPFAVEAHLVPSEAELELGDEIGAEALPSRYELGEDSIVDDNAAEPTLAIAPATDASSNSVDGIDAYEAMLAAQERAEAEAAAAIVASEAATASANVAAAELPSFEHVDATRRWTQLLSGVEVELSAELGRTDLALGDITNLAQDSVLTLEQLVHEPVSVYVNGTRYATARLVVVDGEYGIEILEVVEQGDLVESLAA